MKTRRYSKAQVFRILKKVESGKPVVIAAREHEVSSATIHRWKGKYGGMTLSEFARRYYEKNQIREAKQPGEKAGSLSF